MKIQNYLEKYAKQYQFSGNIGIRIGSEFQYFSFGNASYQHEVKNQLKTKFKIWSLTKQFVATMVLKLDEIGLLSTEQLISELLPDFEVKGKNIKVKHLLDHSSGIKNYSDFDNSHNEFQRLDHNRDELLAELLAKDLDFEAGSSFNYSNSGYFVLGSIIEKVTSNTLDENLQELILDPIGLANTGFVSQNRIVKDLASGYYLNGKHLIDCEYINMDLMSSSGGMYSTTEDILKFDELLHGKKILSEENYLKMTTANQSNYGYGLFIEDHIIDHSGSCEGFISLLRRNQNLDSSIVILSNQGFTNNYKIALAIESMIQGTQEDVETIQFLELESFDIEKFGGFYGDAEDNLLVTLKDDSISLLMDGKYELLARPISATTLHHTWIDERYEFEIDEGIPSIWGMEKVKD